MPPDPTPSLQQQPPPGQPAAQPAAAMEGRRQAFQDIKRQLTSEELANSGTQSRIDGTVYHFFFRGLAQPIYQAQEKRAVLFETNNWITTS